MAHMVLGFDAKQKLIHVQAGIAHSAVRVALATHRGMSLPAVSLFGIDGTIGGAISTGAAGLDAAAHGSIGDQIHQLEVVLSDGSLLQTGRISRREVNQKQSLTNLEGTIYRRVDELLRDNRQLVKQLQQAEATTDGYNGIARVLGADGSLDLTPLFIGAQGSLGIISEVILKTDFIPPELKLVTVAYTHIDEAQEAADLAMATRASFVQVIDGRLLARAKALGKSRDWAPSGCFRGAVVLAAFEDFSERARTRAAKKLLSRIDETNSLVSQTHDIEAFELADFLAPVRLATHPAVAGMVVPSFFTGIRLALDQVDRFLLELRKLEQLHGVELPFMLDARCGFIDLYPAFVLSKISERQAMLKVGVDLARVINQLGGSFAGRGGDGRLKAGLIRPYYDDNLRHLYDAIKQTFDPMGLFAAGVKQDVAGKDLASELNAWCRRLS